MATVQCNRTTAVSIASISHNTKCANEDGFGRDCHNYSIALAKYTVHIKEKNYIKNQKDCLLCVMNIRTCMYFLCR